MWEQEGNTRRATDPDYIFNKCCRDGKIVLPMLQHPPLYLRSLMEDFQSRTASKFKKSIRAYNNAFSFTSLGAKIDNNILSGRGPFAFRIHGQTHHRIGSLLPLNGEQPKFAQLYIYDTAHELRNRRVAVANSTHEINLDESIIEGLKAVLDEVNPYVQKFRSLKDKFGGQLPQNISIRILSERTKDARRYNRPSVDEVAALIFDEGSTCHSNRDIILESVSGPLQRISELHPSYMPLQYPLLFPYGEDGWHTHISYSMSSSSSKSKVSMREYYCYRLQQRHEEGKTLLLSGKLLHQFIVDAFACIEQNRASYIRANQGTFRLDFYKGIEDAIVQGDTTASAIGRRYILPSSFTGSPRYMIQQYQDAMAICRWAGCPDIFLTFTSNPKWIEIQHFIDLIPGQKIEDRPDIIARVFHIKLDQLMEEIKKGKVFGKVLAGKTLFALS